MRANVIFIIACTTAGFMTLPGCDRSKPQAAPASDSISYWTCSMHPEVRQPQPGLCPICGMELIPVKEGPPASAPSPEKKKKYACSMFCVPPLDHPGLCPVCGMEMVVVDDGDAGGESLPEDRTIALSAGALRVAQVDVAPVERGFVETQVRLVGRIDYDETRQGVISARVPGRLDKMFVDYTGVTVAKGDHLVHLYSPELLSAQTELLQSLQGIKEAEPIGIPALREAAESNLRTTREKLLLWGLTLEQLEEIERRGTPTDRITIYAPQEGVVVEKNAVEGMYVETGMKIYTIADLSQVWGLFEAYETDLPWLRYGQPIEVEVQAYPGETFHGVIAFVDPVVDERTRTVKVRANLANSDGRLKPNMFARAAVRSRIAAGGKVISPEMTGKWICPMHPEVVRDKPGQCPTCGMDLKTADSLGFVAADSSEAAAPLVIPVTAALLTGTRAVVYVEVSGQPGSFEGRTIELGPRAGDYYLVREGLTEGERVAVNGNFFIDSAMQIRGKPSMMSPAGSAGAVPAGHQHQAGSPGGGHP